MQKLKKFAIVVSSKVRAGSWPTTIGINFLWSSRSKHLEVCLFVGEFDLNALLAQLRSEA